jgi:glutathione S-transferase
MEWVSLISLLALLQFSIFGILVGRARGKYGISAPATTGNEIFERTFRVHYNSLEKLVVFIPAIWIHGYYIGQYWAAGLGLVYLLARSWYAITYIRDPQSRVVGTLFTELVLIALVVGGIWGASVQLMG